MLALDPDLSPILVSKTSFMPWLLSRIQAKTHDENRGYAAELLAILLQNNRDNRMAFASRDGIEISLQVLFVRMIACYITSYSFYLQSYRKKHPENADEEEFMENIFDSLCSVLQEPENKSLFTSSEGVQLMVIMMK